MGDLGIRAEFYLPDNVVVAENGSVRTIGNSGQRGGVRATSVHGSVRYSLKSFNEMIDVLMINGNKLQDHGEVIRGALASITDYSSITREGAVEVLSKRLLEEYSKNRFYRGELNSFEERRMKELVESNYGNIRMIEGKKSLKSKGICFLYLNGEPTIPAIKKLMEYNQPSSEVRN